MYAYIVKLSEITEHVEALVEKYHLTRLGVFGSVARGEATTESDLDIYADFIMDDPLAVSERYFAFIAGMEALFGCPVQVVTPRMVKNPIFKRSLEQDLIMLHG